jgi:hypothetical protein
MPRVIVQRNIRWNGETFEPGVSVDMPDNVLKKLPPGVVRAMDVPTEIPHREAPKPKPPATSSGPTTTTTTATTTATKTETPPKTDDKDKK